MCLHVHVSSYVCNCAYFRIHIIVYSMMFYRSRERLSDAATVQWKRHHPPFPPHHHHHHRRRRDPSHLVSAASYLRPQPLQRQSPPRHHLWHRWKLLSFIITQTDVGFVVDWLVAAAGYGMWTEEKSSGPSLSCSFVSIPYIIISCWLSLKCNLHA